jgi:hypothetical protein
MRPDRSETINGHLVEEFAWHRDMVVYVDHNRWDASYESGLRWAAEHSEPWRYPTTHQRREGAKE